jgi:hypothetical protein
MIIQETALQPTKLDRIKATFGFGTATCPVLTPCCPSLGLDLEQGCLVLCLKFPQPLFGFVTANSYSMFHSLAAREWLSDMNLLLHFYRGGIKIFKALARVASNSKFLLAKSEEKLAKIMSLLSICTVISVHFVCTSPKK